MKIFTFISFSCQLHSVEYKSHAKKYEYLSHEYINIVCVKQVSKYLLSQVYLIRHFSVTTHLYTICVLTCPTGLPKYCKIPEEYITILMKTSNNKYIHYVIHLWYTVIYQFLICYSALCKYPGDLALTVQGVHLEHNR